MRAVVLLSVFLAAAAAAAPEPSPTPGASPTAAKTGIVVDGVARPSTLLEPQDLGGTWKARFDDDPSFSRPDLDDTGWPVVKVPLGLGLHRDAAVAHDDDAGAFPFRARPGFFWYRLRIELPPPALRPAGLGVMVGQIDSAAEVFIDGVAVGSVGHLPVGDEPGEAAHDRYEAFPVPSGAADDGVLLVAIRGWRSPLRADSNPGRGGITHRPLLVGDIRALTRETLLKDADRVAVSIVFVLAGLYHLHLWRRRRELVAYFWFGLSSVLMSTYMFFGHQLSRILFNLDSVTSTKIVFGSIFLAFPAFLQFLWPFLNTPIRWWWRLVQVGSLVFFVATVAWPSAWFVHKFVMYWGLAIALPEMFGMVALVSRRAWQRDADARTLMIGAVCVLLTTINNLALNANLWQAPEVTNIAFTIFVLSMAASLANRFARLYGEVDEKNAELVRMDKLKDEFLANTSHELRTPLNGIVGIAEGLIDGAAGAQTPQTVENLAMILTSGQRLSSLINDILDFSKLREGKVNISLAPLDIQPAVDIVARLLTPLATQKGLTIENKVPKNLPHVLADESRLQQILTNLIGNAIKFTDEGVVVVEAGVGEDGSVWFAVQDTGPGIDARDHQRIFNAFEQGDGSTERTHGGTGLGLSITRRLVELHGGQIHLASSKGKGSRFTVRLPPANDDARERALLVEPETVKRPQPSLTTTSSVSLAAVTPPATLPASSAAPSSSDVRRYRVLVVDDEPINIRVLENHLSTQQFDVARAADGPAALQLLNDGFKPDLVLLDVMMPKMSGYEVCQQIRLRYPQSEMPVVLVTAKDRIADVVSGFDAGANDYLTKPVAKGELLARIKTHLQVAKMNEATSRFVPFEFLSMLGKQSLLDVARGDQVQKEMSVLFSDIRSFTTLVEKNTPAENIRFINEYLTQMEPPIKDHAGFVDSFIGDAIMALFEGHSLSARTDGSVDENGGAIDAVTAGIGMQRALPAFNAARKSAGLAPVNIGVGVMTGLVTCGTIGGKFHIKCGVIGDAVNTASRIEGMTKMYGVRFLIGDATFARLPAGRFHTRVADKVMAKGKKLPTTIYEVIDAEEDAVIAARLKTLPRFNEGLALYAARRFDEAGRVFDDVIAADDGGVADRLASLYADRCRMFAASPPPEDWDGVVKLETK